MRVHLEWLLEMNIDLGWGGIAPTPEARAQRLMLQPFADSLPSYAGIDVSPNGTLWVIDDWEWGDTARFATAFRPDGAILGRLQFARRVFPIAFGDDRVVVREPDRKTAEAFEVYRFHLAQ